MFDDMETKQAKALPVRPPKWGVDLTGNGFVGVFGIVDRPL